MYLKFVQNQYRIGRTLVDLQNSHLSKYLDSLFPQLLHTISFTTGRKNGIRDAASIAFPSCKLLEASSVTSRLTDSPPLRKLSIERHSSITERVLPSLAEIKSSPCKANPCEYVLEF